jgi:death-on-curing protein
VAYLTLNEVLLLHARLIQLTGGSRGVRDVGSLESALARPRATFDGLDLYPDLWAKAAALMHSLALNHPFLDGNRRTDLTASNDRAFNFTLRVTTGRVDLEEMAAWLRRYSEAQEASRP